MYLRHCPEEYSENLLVRLSILSRPPGGLLHDPTIVALRFGLGQSQYLGQTVTFLWSPNNRKAVLQNMERDAIGQGGRGQRCPNDGADEGFLGGHAGWGKSSLAKERESKTKKTKQD